MTEYQYPRTDWDKPKDLLATLGSFWSQTYGGRNQIDSIVHAKGQIENQTVQDLLEAVQSLSRYSVPIFHCDNWYPLRLLQSRCNDEIAASAKYDGTLTYNAGHRYDQPLRVANTYTWAAPSNLHDARLIFNRFTAPSLTWTNGIDFDISDGCITFYANPFDDNRVARQPVYSDGILVDEEAVLWIFRGDLDWDYVYEQFAYVLGIKLQSSANYKQLVNAIFDALVGGTTRRQMELGLSAITGIPLVIEPTEIVEHIINDGTHLLVITDAHVYRFVRTVTVSVAVGDVVYAGDSLVDALNIHEFTYGAVPTDLPALAIGKGMLATCYYSDLIFENRDVPLEVIESSEAPFGYTYVRFAVGGFPLDVQQFFDTIHERGVAAAERPLDDCDTTTDSILVPGDEDLPDQRIRCGTLAHLLDQRVEKIGEPTAASLPSTINPLQFVVANILRNNATLVRIRMSGMSPDGLGLQALRFLRTIVPPHTAVLVLVDIDTITDKIDPEELTAAQLATFNQIGAMYIEFENVADPADPVTVPEFDLDEGIEYYNGLYASTSRDYLRVAVDIKPDIGEYASYSAYLSEHDENCLTFRAQTSGVIGVHGKLFSDSVNSKVCGAALVATPVFADPTNDSIFARVYFEEAHQVAKVASSQIGVTWEVSFT